MVRIGWEPALDLGRKAEPRSGAPLGPEENSPFWRHSLLMQPALLRNRLFCVNRQHRLHLKRACSSPGRGWFRPAPCPLSLTRLTVPLARHRLVATCKRSDALPAHCALSVMSSRTQAATESASTMFSIALRRLFE